MFLSSHENLRWLYVSWPIPHLMLHSLHTCTHLQSARKTLTKLCTVCCIESTPNAVSRILESAYAAATTTPSSSTRTVKQSSNKTTFTKQSYPDQHAQGDDSQTDVSMSAGGQGHSAVTCLKKSDIPQRAEESPSSSMLA